MLTAGEKIRVILKRRNMTIKDLARILETAQSNISDKLKRDNFTENDLKQIAAALNCDYEAVFTLKDTNERI